MDVFVITRFSEMLCEATVLFDAFRNKEAAEKAIEADIAELNTDREDYAIHCLTLHDYNSTLAGREQTGVECCQLLNKEAEMPRYLVSERQIVLVSATIEAENAEEAKTIFLDGDPTNIETEVLDSYDLSVEALTDE